MQTAAVKSRSRKVRPQLAKGRNNRVAAAAKRWRKRLAKHRGGDGGCYGTLISAFTKIRQKDFNFRKNQ
jgi:hypothetical protein